MHMLYVVQRHLRFDVRADCIRDRCLDLAVDIWRTRVKAGGERVAYRYRQDGRWASMTWRQADEAAGEIAAGLASLGVGRAVRLLPTYPRSEP